MKFNKWTLGLAAIGAVSLTSAARADEAKLSPIESATSGIVISGYVDVAAQYNMGNVNTGSATPAGTGGNAFSSLSKIDSFSLNNITISIDKAQDESPWAAGYHVDLNYGADAINGLSSVASGGLTGNGINNFGVRQAYVVVRTPIGNGIDWKFGVQDDIIGYEGNTDGANPNYTRSIGYSMEPTTLVGLIGTYKITDSISVSGGVANAVDSGLYPTTVSSKTLAASAALTAPDSWGFLKGGTLNVGTLLNLEKNGVNNYYAGVVIPTPMSKLKLGGAFDLISAANKGVTGVTAGNDSNDSGWVVGLYGNFQATEKLSLNLRGEYYDLTGVGYGSTTAYSPTANGKGEEVTATIAYNLWANVISRAEFRWDHLDQGTAFADGGAENSFLAAVNLIYTF